jgi:hypothetical protein
MRTLNNILFGICVACFFAAVFFADTAGSGTTNSATTTTTSAPMTAVAATSPTTRTYTYDAAGWTIVTPTGPAIYLDPVHGVDTAAGTQIAPTKTFGTAYKRARANGAIYIARGTTLTENLPGSVLLAGLTIGAYGDVTTPRPIWMLDAAKPNGVIHLCGEGQSLLDIDFHQFGHTPADAGFNPQASCGHGLYIAAANVLLEGCRWQGFFQAINAIGVANPVIRRCTIIDSFTTSGGHAQGLYTDSVSNALIEENIFVGNGWVKTNPTQVNQAYWQFNHAVYIDDDARPFEPVIFRRNIVADSAGCGIQCRPGGVVSGNFFLDNGAAGLDAFVGGTSGTLTGNVVTGSADAPARSVTRGEGLGCDALNGVCTNNLLVHSAGTRVAAIRVSAVTSNGFTYGPTSSATIAQNTIYDWNGLGITSDVPRQVMTSRSNVVQTAQAAVDFVNHPVTWGSGGNVYQSTGQNTPYRIAGGNVTPAVWAAACGETAGTAIPAFVDPTRTIESYSKSVGLDGTGANWLKYAVAQRKGYWDSRYQAAGATAYFQAGFAPKVPVATPAAQGTPVTVKWPVTAGK